MVQLHTRQRGKTLISFEPHLLVYVWCWASYTQIQYNYLENFEKALYFMQRHTNLKQINLKLMLNFCSS